MQDSAIDNYISFSYFSSCCVPTQFSNVKSNVVSIRSYSLLIIFCVLNFISVFLDRYSYIALGIIPVRTCSPRWTFFFSSETNETKRLKTLVAKKIIHGTSILSTNFLSLVVSFFFIQPCFCFVSYHLQVIHLALHVFQFLSEC